MIAMRFTLAVCAVCAATTSLSSAQVRISPDRREYVRPSLGQLTPEAEALLGEYAKRGETRKTVLPRPQMIVRGQWRYGNDREDFIHAWYERPLYQDSSLVATREKGHFINADSWKLDVVCMKEAKFDAAGFFPHNPGCMDVMHRSTLPGGEIKIVPQFEFRESFFADHLKLAGRLLETPNALRFNDRVVIPFYGAIGWWETNRLERLRRFRSELETKYGKDRFALIIRFRIFAEHDLNQPRLTAQTVKKVHDGLVAAMNGFDGMFYTLLDTSWMPYENSGIPNETIFIPLVKSVMSLPENSGKYLGIEYHTGHQNTYRRITDYSCMGMERLRVAMESCRRLKPDFTWGSEWDEENENDHFTPIVSSGKAVARMMRYYADSLAGRQSSPMPGDDASIPNFVLSYRKALVLGECVEAQVMNIPDGTACYDYMVSFRWRSPDGRVVKDFGTRKLAANACRSETFAVSSVDVSSERILMPELTVVDANGKRQVFTEGFWPLGIEGTRTLDAYWVKHPLREICRGISGALEIGQREANGTYIVSGIVKGPKKFRSVEVLENSDSIYVYDAANARPKDGVDISVSFKTLGKNRYRRSWPECKVWLETSHGRILGDSGKYRDFKDFRFFVPTAGIAGAAIEIDLPNESFHVRVPVADVVRDDAYSYSIADGGQAVVRCAYGTHRIPRPAMTEKAEFSFRMKPLDPNANLRLQVVDEDYHVWRGPFASFYRPSGRMVPIHVFDDALDGAREVEIDSARLYKLKYDFTKKRSDDIIYPIDRRLDSPCVFGGSISLVTGVGYGHENCWYQHALNEAQVDFSKVGRFASLPMQFNPWRAGFALVVKVRPEKLEGRQSILDSWALGFKLQLCNGVPVAHFNDGNRLWRGGVNMMSGTTLVGPAVSVKEWSTIAVEFNQRIASISVNGTPGDALPLCCVEGNPHTMVLGCNTSGRNGFCGEIGYISVEPR